MTHRNYCLVKQQIIALVEDTPFDYDRFPDKSEINGDVIIAPNVSSGQAYHVTGEDGTPYTMPLASIRAKIVDGRIWHEGEPGVYVFAAGEGSNPDAITYQARYVNLEAGGVKFTLNPVSFRAVPGGVVDLTTVTPVTGAVPAGTTKGDRGTSLEAIAVDGSELVFTASDATRSFEISRIPLDEMVRAEADAAAVLAADGVRNEVKLDADRAEAAADRAEAAADRADTRVDTAINDGASLVRDAVKLDADRAEAARQESEQSASNAAADTAVALREEMKPVTQANAAYMGQSLAAYHMATESVNAAKASEDRAQSWAELAETLVTSTLARLDNIRAWFRGAGAPPETIPGARVGDWWLDTSSMTLHEITGVEPAITSEIIGKLDGS